MRKTFSRHTDRDTETVGRAGRFHCQQRAHENRATFSARFHMVVLSINILHAFIMKDPLVQYCLHQAGRGSHSRIGPIYSFPHFVQRGHGIGSFLRGLFCMVRPVLWSGVKVVGRETLCTGGKILSDLAENTSGHVKFRHIIAKHVSDSAHNLIQILRGKRRKRAATLHSRGLSPERRRRKRQARLQNGTSFHRTYHFISEHSCGRSVSKHRVRHICY